MGLLGFIVALLFILAVGIIAFLIHPVVGVLLVLWLIGVAIFTIKKNRRR